MVSGLVTSPEDQSRICLLEASPIRIASKSLMSINSVPSLFDFRVGQLDFAERADLFLDLFLRLVGGGHLHVLEVAERLVRGQLQLAGLVHALLALLRFLPGRLARGGAQRAGRQVDAELLGGA